MSTLSLAPPSPPTPVICGADSGDGDGAQRRVQQQRVLQQRKEEVARLEATLARERVDNVNSLNTLRASLQREHLLRTTAEKGRQAAQAEGRHLRTALRALLAQIPNNSSTGSLSSTVPVCLYEEARRLLLRCERTFAELKALQLRSTDPAGLEVLRRYDIPVLDEIPPAWPPGTPQRSGKEEEVHAAGVTRADGGPNSTTAAREKAASGTTLFPMEETLTGLEISELTTLSPDTPCSPSPATRQVRAVTAACEASEKWCEKGHGPPAHTSSNGMAKSDVGGETLSPDGRRRSRPALLSPPLPSSETSAAKVVQPWMGPMHKFAGSKLLLAATPSQELHAEHHTQLSELGREDTICDMDHLLRSLAEEIATLATSQGLRTASEVAALCRRCGLHYVDAAFLPVPETLGFNRSGACCGYDADRRTSFVVEWRPRDAVVPRGRKAELLTSAGIDPDSLRCGLLGDIGVVAALAALAESAGAVMSVLASTTGEDEDNGVYVVWLCVHGWWTRVTVDAYLPCVIEENRPVDLYGCSSTTTYDLWAPVCEKALAKVLCGYHPLCSLSAETAIGNFTGGPVECWDWWHRRSNTALEEMEAALNTNARGAGIVLLSTFSTAALRDTSTRSVAGAGAHAAYQRLGLRPGTPYRVLAVADTAEGEPMVLLRNWTRRCEQRESDQACCLFDRDPAVGGGDRRNISPRRDSNDGTAAAKGWLTRPLSQSSPASSQCDSCVWLSYTKEVLPYFDGCHVCFDCRRYHDLRVPIAFSGSQPAIPAQLVRVRVQEGLARPPHGVTRCPTRLWIGLHQPFSSVDTSDAAPASFPWGLKMTLVGQEEAPAPFGESGGCARPARRSYILSESFLGEPKELPAVWMYLELEPVTNSAPHLVTDLKHEDAAAVTTTTEFFVVPQMEWIVRKDRAHTGHDDDGLGSLGCDVPSVQHWRGVGQASQRRHFGKSAAPHSGQSGCSGDAERAVWYQGSHHHPTSIAEHSFDNATTAIVAVLAERRESVLVDVVDAPEELRAAMYHDVLDRIDFSDCTGSGGSGQRHTSHLSQRSAAKVPGEVRCQVNGRCLPTFSW
ncbi:hypothetical protein, unknown function [Leishmania mexicana MHOM/GT/2001/U1103]|uniref:Calpain catalytic domain-containing protein n=1 Tax=Leishmania mexicana (strain MHOM/GT/2001/U1103) TaxID=929439 RepID=E9ASJ8_LEIMU|nr:hypothetical protein, unknown function [Leishmania mexicana MHOM/GT/2001/U1103]CBZ25921.1 hypothetical protein, unknown function [Leishmania mexicana MHOM/GT/2001/U1103]